MSDSPPSAPIRADSLPILRAAYSDRTAALMATLASLAYDFPPASCAPGPAPEIPEDFKRLGFDAITYFHSGLENGWAYIVEGKDIIVIAFRGTQSIQDWKTDFHVRMIYPPETNKNLRAHEGFYQAFNALNQGPQGLENKFKSILSNAVDQGVPIYLTGHSLGGALAQIATAVFECDQIAACYTFGSPRVGNKYFDLWVKPPSYRVENDADIVPQVPIFAPQWPPILYRHSGDARYLPTKVDGTVYRYEPGLLTRASQIIRGLVEALFKWSILGVADHARTEYVEKLSAVAEGRPQARDPSAKLLHQAS